MSSRLCISVIASTSSGNCTVIWNGSSAVLVDCGLGINRILANLNELGVNINSLKGVFITHLHHDHIKKTPLKFFCKNNIPLFCHVDMKEILCDKFPFLKNGEKYGKLIVYDKHSVAGDFFVSAFDVPHDADGGCKGFNVYCRVNMRVKKISISTDLAYISDVVLKRFVNSDIIVIESNYDLKMLDDSKRTTYLKERIKEVGHLSNEQSSQSVGTVLLQSRRKAKTIIVAHISQECNENDLATSCMKEKVLTVDCCSDIKIVETFKDKRSQTVVVS